MIPVAKVSTKLKEIEDPANSRLAELERTADALTKLSAEVATLKTSYNSDLERALATQAERHKAELDALKDRLATAEENAEQARTETTTLQARAREWKQMHSRICTEFNGKLLFFALPTYFPIRGLFCNRFSCPNLQLPFQIRRFWPMLPYGLPGIEG